MPDSQLVDPFGRRITYLRLSVTDRCDFRCTYCMSEDMVFVGPKLTKPSEDLMTPVFGVLLLTIGDISRWS